MNKEKEEQPLSRTNSNKSKTDVSVHNNFNFTINLGDSLSLVALIAGVYVIKRVATKQKTST
ncbi:hypothetical protein [Bacillus seohaeanensis]|jgi:hypothetical protein|uniref:LPXTG cell wall anchor domain-containing protein n=1 Tax=Bacillus seohaeanensis TaxID=284580 RepID=A0ABW5RTG8_9BACI